MKNLLAEIHNIFINYVLATSLIIELYIKILPNIYSGIVNLSFQFNFHFQTTDLSPLSTLN